MIEGDRADRRKGPQVILVRRIIAVPANHVDRRVRQLRPVERSAPFHEQLGRSFFVLVRRDWSKEVARIRQAVRADGAAFGKREGAPVIFAQVAARWA